MSGGCCSQSSGGGCEEPLMLLRRERTDSQETVDPYPQEIAVLGRLGLLRQQFSPRMFPRWSPCGVHLSKDTFRSSTGLQSQTHQEMVTTKEGSLSVENFTSFDFVQMIAAKRIIFLQNTFP